MSVGPEVKESDTKPDPDNKKFYQITETGEFIETTKQEHRKALRKQKKEIIAHLENCIDNDLPFLVVISETPNMDPEGLRFTSSVVAIDLSRLLGPLFMSIPYNASRLVLDSIKDMVYLKMLEEFLIKSVSEVVDKKLLAFGFQMSARNLGTGIPTSEWPG